jgi:hypothetical protein
MARCEPGRRQVPCGLARVSQHEPAEALHRLVRKHGSASRSHPAAREQDERPSVRPTVTCPSSARHTMHRVLYGLAFCLLTGQALAQTGGATSGGAGSPGAAAPSAAPSVAPGATTAPPTSTAPLNTQVLPPSRSLLTPAPSTSSPSQPGTGSVPGSPAAGAPAAPDPNLPATASGGRPQPGGAQSTRTGKNPINERYADCVKLWDNQTHMSKVEWSKTCRRIENRLQNLNVEKMDVDISGPKPRRAGKTPGSG